MNKRQMILGLALVLLSLVLATLKLMRVITVSWWWVTAPLWGGVALAAAAVVLFVIALGIASRNGKPL